MQNAFYFLNEKQISWVHWKTNNNYTSKWTVETLSVFVERNYHFYKFKRTLAKIYSKLSTQTEN